MVTFSYALMYFTSKESLAMKSFRDTTYITKTFNIHSSSYVHICTYTVNDKSLVEL